MDPVFAFFAALGGYLIGSVSFARLMIRAQGMEGRNDLIRREVEGSDADFVSDSVGGTTVAEQLGRRLGCLTALLDIAKPIVVILATLAFLPDEHYHLIAGVFTVVGHNYPVFHRFDGGRGMSTLVGGFLVVDPLGFFATQVTAMALGIAVRRVLVLRWSGIVFMIPWLFVVQGVPEGLFAVACNALYWTAMYPEIAQVRRFQAEGTLPDQQVIAELLQMGGFWAKVEPYSIPRLLKRRR